MPPDGDNPREKRADTERENRHCIMLIDSLPRLGEQLFDILDDSSLRVATTTRWKHALRLCADGKVSLMICDLELPDDGAAQLFHEVKSNFPGLQPALLFSRNVMTRPEAHFLSAGERRELLDRPFQNDQALKVLTRRLNRVGIRPKSY